MNIYDLSLRGNVKSNKGTYYPDVCSIDFNKLKYDKFKKGVLDIGYIERFYVVVYYIYKSCDYEEIILWLNKIAHKNLLETNDILVFPNKNYLDEYITKYRR